MRVENECDDSEHIDGKRNDRDQDHQDRRMPAPALEEVDEQDSQHAERHDRAEPAACLHHDEAARRSQDLVSVNQGIDAHPVQDQSGELRGDQLNREDRRGDQDRRDRKRKAEKENRQPIGSNRRCAAKQESHTGQESDHAGQL